jgi:hypothetical protein
MHRRFVRDAVELERYRLGAKLRPCPHCGRHGTLNAHGTLSGYAEVGQARVMRGARFFCSNRGRRPGCGRTVSVLLAHVIPAFCVGTRTLSRFVRAVVDGDSRRAAWQRSATLALQSGYRLWRRLSQAQARLRTALCRRAAPPSTTHHEPLAQLLLHIRHVATVEDCELTAFQLCLQTPILS